MRYIFVEYGERNEALGQLRIHLRIACDEGQEQLGKDTLSRKKDLL